VDALLSWLDGEEELPQWRNFSDQVDAGRDLARKVSWHDEIIHQISQFCASFYSERDAAARSPIAASTRPGWSPCAMIAASRS
jgi:hypothetical protein